MPTSPLYDTTHRYLKTHLTEALESQIETLALVVVAISHSVSTQLGKIARAMPLDTTHAAKEQRIRRLLDNERLVQAEHYQPLAKAAWVVKRGYRHLGVSPTLWSQIEARFKRVLAYLHAHRIR